MLYAKLLKQASFTPKINEGSEEKLDSPRSPAIISNSLNLKTPLDNVSEDNKTNFEEFRVGNSVTEKDGHKESGYKTLISMAVHLQYTIFRSTFGKLFRSSMLPSATSNNRDSSNDKSHMRTRSRSDNINNIILKVNLDNMQIATMKVAAEMYMSDILHLICQKRALDPKEHQLQLFPPRDTEEVDMDKRFEFYTGGASAMEIYLKKVEKKMETVCISENGCDVMIIRTDGEEELIMAGTKDKLLTRLTDVEEDGK